VKFPGIIAVELPAHVDAIIAGASRNSAHVVRLDTSAWRDENDIHDSFAAGFDFPDYYGRNLNALLDCLRDVCDRAYGWPPGTERLFLVLANFDDFWAEQRELAKVAIELFATAAWERGPLAISRIGCIVECETWGGEVSRWVIRQ
jgi:RNAse (barnase) inhibitor barstar